jgi:rSAM/selenodomain-associated transferase 2
VDGGSSDSSIKRINEFERDASHRVSLLRSESGRARQQNAGASVARGHLVMFLHADTLLPANSIEAILQYKYSDHLWGRFDVRLNANQLSFRVIEWFINKRSRLTGISTGDQAIFVSKILFDKAKGFPDQLLMEDIELSKRLKKYSKPKCLKTKVTTSARKWIQNGTAKTVLLMWKIRAAYFFGATPESLHRQYYKKSTIKKVR